MSQTQLPAFSKDLKLTFHTNQQTTNSNHEVNISNEEKAIYTLQTIKVGQQQYSLFYDIGCCDMVSRYNAIKAIGDRAVQELFRPISIGGVGNADIKTTHDIYRVKLPLCNGNDAVFSGVCLDQITVQVPKYPLQGRVEGDIRNDYKQIVDDLKNLPKLPRHVGENTDFMTGITILKRYYNYHQVYLPTNHVLKFQMAQKVSLVDHMKFLQE